MLPTPAPERPSPYAGAAAAIPAKPKAEGKVSDNVVLAEAMSALLRKGMLHRSEIPRAERIVREAYPPELLDKAKGWREKHGNNRQA